MISTVLLLWFLKSSSHFFLDENDSRGEAMYMARVVVFHLVELSQRGMLTSLISARCGETLCAVLSVAQQLRGDALRNCIQV